jgi:hypothetical protein
MTKRRAAWAGVAAVAAGLFAACVLLLRSSPPNTVTEANCERFANGMTLAEVEALFGRPADAVQDKFPRPPQARGAVTRRVWRGRGRAVDVFFDGDGRAVQKDEYPWEPAPLHRRLARMVGL